jgi:RNA polymerase sigma-70 factor (ECF subfamily)
VLYRVARRLTPNAAEAEDLVGQALAKAAGAWSGFSGEYPRSWLIRILTNCHFGVLRSRKTKPADTSLDPDLVADEPWSAIDWGLVGPNLMEEVDRLPPEYRLAVVLCDVEEMSYDEAAAAMEVSVGTAKSRVFRGRRLLRARLAGFYSESNR